MSLSSRRRRRAASRSAAIALAAWTLRVAAQQGPLQDVQPPLPVSISAQRIYEDARGSLVQVRTLLKGQDSQSSVGSGFFMTSDGYILTNYHVVSEAALQPERYRLVYRTTDGAAGPLQLVAFDAIHDLAVVKPATPPPFARRALAFRPRPSALEQGEQIYSLGNPLDVGFAVIEGTYNGLVERSFYPTIFFAGSLNRGVSGGPAVDTHGQVIGVNVASRLDGQQVSFLVPAAFAEDLLQRARGQAPLVSAAYPELARQLTVHQATLTERFLKQPWRNAGHPRYLIPVPQEEFMRCWGRSTPSDTKGLEDEQSRCAMDTRIYVSESLTTGSLSVRHEVYDGRKLGVLRFADRYSRSFANEWFGGDGGKDRTVPHCQEQYVDGNGLPLRAVLCMSAYKRLKGLYTVSVLVGSVDQPLGGVEARFDADGVTFDNALALSAHFLEGFRMDAQGLGPDRMKLAVVELLDRDGHVRQFVPVWQWPVTIGRAIDCDVVLDDPNAAPHHATLTEVDGTLRLVVDETLNGVSIGRRRYAAQQTAELAAGDVLAIGSSTRLSVRRAADPLAPERSIAADARVRAQPVVLLALVYMALIAGRHWVMVDPGGRLIDDLLVVVGSMLALAAWTGFWAVGSKLVRHRFDPKPHAQIALSYTLGSAMVTTILPLLAFATGVAFFSRVSGIAAAGVIWAMVLAHLTLILPARQRFLAVTMALLFTAGVSMWVARTYQNQERFFNELYVTTMAPPSLRLAPAEPAAQFISDARRLKAVLDAHVHDDRGDAGGGSDEQE